jgi:hypothetical protein
MSDAANTILSRFPGPVTLKASRLKWGAILLGCAVFLCLVDFLRGNLGEIEFWICAVVFGAGVVVAVVPFVAPHYLSLVLDRDGFEWSRPFRSGNRIRWRDATNFQSWQPSASRVKTVVFDDAAHNGTTRGSLNKSIAGRNSGMPDTYGLSADDLAYLLNQWRERAMK